MKKYVFLTNAFLCLILALGLFSDAGATGSLRIAAVNPLNSRQNWIRERYGNNVARVYETVKGMPVLDPDSKHGLDIRYNKDDHPCNEIFLRENPDMAEDCKKARERITYINRYGKRVSVDIKGGEIVSIDLSTPLDKRKPMRSRDVILLYNALIVHDCVLASYSKNHAKIFHFPWVVPSVSFDGEQNVVFRFGNEDFIKFHAEDFKKTECRGFRLSCQPTFYRNGTRAIPDIRYEGNQAYMVTTNWSYPPLDGDFILYKGSKKIGNVPANLLYKRLKNDRALPLFKEEGLLTYLRKHYKRGVL